MDDETRRHLRRCVELATEALESGNEPFGSLLVDADGTVLFEDHNRTGEGDPMGHPELALARWAVEHLDVEARARTTVYTSGEHCPMCAAAHAWSGLGPIVYASSAGQLTEWLGAAGLDPAPVADLSIHQVAPDVTVSGPFPEYAEQVHRLHLRRLGLG